MRRETGALVLAIVVAGHAFAQTPLSPDGSWSGTVRCTVLVTAPDYQHRETHTWVLSGGAPVVQGALRVHPATWSVEGSGRSGNGSSWTTAVPPTSAPLAILIRASDGRLLINGAPHSQLRASGGTRYLETATTAGAPAELRFDVYEWGLPAMDAAVTSARVSGSRTEASGSNVGPRQRSGLPVSSTCEWDFAPGGAIQTLAPVQQSGALTVASGPAGSVSAPVPAPPRTIAAPPDAAGTATAPSAPRLRTLPETTTLTDASAGPATPTDGIVRAAWIAPSTVFAGEQAAVGLSLQVAVRSPDTIVIARVDITVESGAGESAKLTLPSAASSPALLPATFTYRAPGAYNLSARGTASTVRTITEVVPRYEQRSVYSPSCMCNTTYTVTHYDTRYRQETASFPVSVQRIVTVAAR